VKHSRQTIRVRNSWGVGVNLIGDHTRYIGGQRTLPIFICIFFVQLSFSSIITKHGTLPKHCQLFLGFSSTRTPDKLIYSRSFRIFFTPTPHPSHMYKHISATQLRRPLLGNNKIYTQLCYSRYFYTVFQKRLLCLISIR